MDNIDKNKAFADNLFVFNEKQKEVTSHLINTLKKFNELILADPLLLQIGTHTSIAGGAIRDLILNKTESITDIDIIISPNLTPLPNSPDEINQTMARITRRCLESNINITGKTDSQLYFELLSQVVSKHYTINQKFDNNMIIENVTAEQSEYEDCGINGVLKIKDIHNKYDIDIIFITNQIDHFVEKSFDYGICKSQLKFNKICQYTNKPQYTSDYNASYFHDYKFNDDNLAFIVSHEFIDNVVQKKITYDVGELTVKQVENSLFKHLGKVFLKYPNYDFTLVNPTEEHTKLLNKVELFHRLNVDLSQNKPTYKKLKI